MTHTQVENVTQMLKEYRDMTLQALWGTQEVFEIVKELNYCHHFCQTRGSPKPNMTSVFALESTVTV